MALNWHVCPPWMYVGVIVLQMLLQAQCMLRLCSTPIRQVGTCTKLCKLITTNSGLPTNHTHKHSHKHKHMHTNTCTHTNAHTRTHAHYTQHTHSTHTVHTHTHTQDAWTFTHTCNYKSSKWIIHARHSPTLEIYQRT